MALTTMYAGMSNSPKTSLASAVSANDTSITVVDSSVLPEAPNIAVIGSSTDAEVIIYSGKNGNKLTGVLRGKGNTVGRSWDEQTAVARNFTIIDYDAICDNIRDLESRKRNTADKIDAASQMSGALPVANGGTGKTDVAGIKTLLGLAAMAYKAVVSLVDDVTGVLKVANGGTGLSSSPSLLINLASTTAAHVLQASPRPGVTGTLPVGNGGTGQTSLQALRNAMGLGNTTGVLPIANGGSGLSSSPSLLINLAATAAANVFAASPRPGVTGTLGVGNGGTGQTSLQATRNAMGLGNTTGAVPVANGGTGATAAAAARSNLGVTDIATRANYDISTAALTPGTSALATGKLYFQYE